MAMSRAELEAKIADFPFWYHKIPLVEGLETPGWAPIYAPAYKIPEDLTGMRVLDVGAWDGYWTFEALRRGAKEVVAIDDFSDFLGHLDPSERREWGTFDLCQEALGYSPDQCRRETLSVYDISPERLGSFDIAFCFGTLYHLRHPLLALDKIASVCTGDLFVESAICDDFSPYQGGFGKGYSGQQMVMEFYPNEEYGGNATNWWAPTLACMSWLVVSAGWNDADAWKLTDTPDQLPLCRGFVHGRNRAPDR